MKRFLVFFSVFWGLSTPVRAELLMPEAGQTLGAGGHLHMHRVVVVDENAPEQALTVGQYGEVDVDALNVNTLQVQEVDAAEIDVVALSISGDQVNASAAELNRAVFIDPPGSIQMYAGSTAPQGWLLCDGSAVSRSTYAALFAAIGTTFGTGDGSTTFNLPNLKGRAVIGQDPSDTDFNSIGKTGGEKEHILTIDEMPSHKHDLYGDDVHDADSNLKGIYQHTDSGYNGIVGYSSGIWGSADPEGREYIANTGGDQPHNNLQPYIVMNYIIKY